MAQRISMVSGVAQVQVFGSQKYAVRVQLDPQRAGRRAASASTRWPTRSPAGQRQPADRHALRRASRPSPSRPPASSPRPRPTGPMIVAYRNGQPGAAGRGGHGHRQRARTTRSPPGTSTQRARSCWPSSGSPAPTPWRWPTRSSALLPTFRAQLPASVDAATSCYDRSRVHPRVGRRREVHPAAHPGRWWSWSSSCSCATSRPRSSPAWPCPCPSSAPSPSCTSWATAWTTSR